MYELLGQKGTKLEGVYCRRKNEQGKLYSSSRRFSSPVPTF